MTTTRELEKRGLAAIRLVQGLEELADDAVLDGFRIDGDENHYIDLMVALHDSGLNESPKRLRPSADPASVVAAIAAPLETSPSGPVAAAAVAVMLGVEEDWPWDSLIDSLKSGLGTAGAIESSTVSSGLRVAHLLATAGNQRARDVLTELVANGYVLHHLYSARSVQDVAAEAACVFVQAEHGAGGKTQSIGNSSNGLPVYQEVVASPSEALVTEGIQFLGSVHGLQPLAAAAERHSEARPLLQAVAAAIAKTAAAAQWINPNVLVRHFDLLRKPLDAQTLERLLNAASYRRALMKAITEHGFRKGLVDLYLTLLSVEDAPPEVGPFLREGLGTVSESSWRASIKTNDSLVRLIEVLPPPMTPQLSGHLPDALLSFVRDVLGAEEEAVDAEQVAPLMKLLEPGARKTLLRDVRDEVFAQTTRSTDGILEMFGEYLLDVELLGEKADDMVRRFFREGLVRSNPGELVWIRRVLVEAQEAYKRAPRESKSAFLKDLRGSVGEGAQPELIALARTLEVEVPEDPDRDRKHDASDQKE
jgi:hypothetical protein